MMPIWLFAAAVFEVTLTFHSAGSNIASRIASTPMTTSNSNNVNPHFRIRSVSIAHPTPLAKRLVAADLNILTKNLQK